MKTLQELQSRFYYTLMNESDELATEVCLQGTLTAQERISIYADGYRLRLIEALQDTYPALHTLMGDELFEVLCLNYIDENPSRHFSIRFFGHQLAEFVKKKNPQKEGELLSEMASFEWALRDAFDATDQTPLQLSDLAQLPPEAWSDLTFKLHPSLIVLTFRWNVPALWKAIEQAADPQSPKKNISSIKWLIWRPNLETHFHSMDSKEAAGLQIINQGKTFAQLCELMTLEGDTHKAAQCAAEYLAKWIEEGLLLR